jgi:hypothetical protein
MAARPDRRRWRRLALAVAAVAVAAPRAATAYKILAVPLPGADSHLFTMARVTAELTARGHEVMLAVAESDVDVLERAAPGAASRVAVYRAAYTKQVGSGAISEVGSAAMRLPQGAARRAETRPSASARAEWRRGARAPAQEGGRPPETRSGRQLRATGPWRRHP